MKQILLFIGLALTILMSFLPASGYDLEVDGICYNVISLEDCTVETTMSYHPKLAKGGVLNIPNYITHNGRTLTVIRIGEDSFKSSKADIKKVNIGDKILQISEGAFCGRLKLTSVYAPSIKEIGTSAFAWCKKLTDVDFGSGLEVIGEKAFRSCEELTSIYAPYVIEIWHEAFWGCDKLSTVVFGSNLKFVGNRAFYSCKSLQDIKLPSTIQGVGVKCFAWSGLVNFELYDVANSDNHDTMPIISEGAFRSCDNLISVKGLGYMTELPDSLFYWCSELDISDILASEKLRVIGSGALAGCKFPEEIIIKPSIKKLGKGALGGYVRKLNILDSEEILEIDKFDNMNVGTFRLGRDLSTWEFFFSKNLEEFIVGPLVTAVAPSIHLDLEYSICKGMTYGGAPFRSCSELRTVLIEPGSNVLEISGVGREIRHTITPDYGMLVYDESYSGLFSECPISTLKLLRPIKLSDVNLTYKYYKRKGDLPDIYNVVAPDPFYEVPVEDLTINYDNFNNYHPDDKLHKLYISYYVPEVPDLSVCQLTEVSVRNGEPPIALGFNAATYMNGKLLVPTGTKDLYKEDDTWGKFWLIEEDERLFDKITAIRLPDEEKSLAVGETVSLKPLIVPDFATIKKLSYSSSDPNVVSCNEDGELKAESIGSATITISACDGSDVSLEYKINVTE